MKHSWFKCEQPCMRPSCPYCVGGLGLCTICGGAEGTLTTDCCRFRLNKYVLDAIYNGGLDFKGNVWIVREVQDGP